MPPAHDEAVIRRYLLGELPEPEASALEREYFADGELFERIWSVENDLVDDYVGESLSPSERTRFEHRYLASARHRERVAAARELLARTRGRSPRRIGGRAAWLWMAATLVLGLAVGRVLLPRAAPVDTAEAPRPRAPAATEPPSPAPAVSESPARPGDVRPGAAAVLALSPVLLRAPGGPPTLRLARDTKVVQLQLEGDGGEPPGALRSPLAFAVRTVEGRPVAAGHARPPTGPGPAGVLASVQLPSAKLPPGDYILALSSREAGPEAPLHQYFFRIVER